MPDPAQRPKKRWKAIPPNYLGHPIILFFVVMLALEISNHWSDGNTRTEVLTRTVLLEPAGKGWKVRDFDEESVDTDDLFAVWNRAVVARAEMTWHYRGWLAPVWVKETSGPVYTSTGWAITPATLNPAFAEWLTSRRLIYAAEIVGNGAVVQDRRLWSGWAIHVATILSWLLVLAVLARLPVWWRSRRVRLAFAKGRCPGCQYTLVGIPEQGGVAQCPECGDESRQQREPKIWVLTPRWRLGNPAVAIVAAAGLMFACLSIDRVRPTVWQPIGSFFVYGDQHRLEIRPAEHEASEAFETAPIRGLARVDQATYRRGLWAATSQATETKFSLQSMTERPRRVEWQEAVTSYLDKTGEQGASPWVRDGPTIKERVLWLGYGTNLLTLASLGVLCGSLWCLPTWYRSRRTREAFAKGECPGCECPLDGLVALEGKLVCPGCGDESRWPAGATAGGD